MEQKSLIYSNGAFHIIEVGTERQSVAVLSSAGVLSLLGFLSYKIAATRVYQARIAPLTVEILPSREVTLVIKNHYITLDLINTYSLITAMESGTCLHVVKEERN